MPAVLFLAAAIAGLSASSATGSGQHTTPEQLTETTEPGERNAFAALWLLAYDVPEAEQAQIADEDVGRFNTLVQARTSLGDDSALINFESIAKDRYPDLSADLPKHPAYCHYREPGCLATVAAARADYSARMAKESRLIERIRALAQYDHFRSPMLTTLHTPFSNLNLLRAAQTQHALDFVAGRTEQALSGVCGDVVTWRQLGKNPDSLIIKMMSAAVIRGSNDLLADMLLELPIDQKLPAVCEKAFVWSSTDELSICNAMRGEYALVKNTLAHLKAGIESGKIESESLDSDRTLALLAPNYAWACTAAVTHLIATDRPAQQAENARAPPPLECESKDDACHYAQLIWPSYDDYILRAQDAGAQLRSMAAVLWLREHADDRRTLTQRLTDLPEELHSPTRPIEASEDGSALRVRMYSERYQGEWRTPLPPALRD